MKEQRSEPMFFKRSEVRTLLEQFDFFEDEDGEVGVAYSEAGHSGPGLYAFNNDLPDEGSCFLGLDPMEGEPIIDGRSV